jgi:hypothetical protein
MAEELLNLHQAVERYKELEGLIKTGLQQLKHKEIATDKGRVFISTSERVSVSADLAREVLGPDAVRIIRIKEVVPNELIKAFVEVGDISQEQRDRLMAGAEKTPVVSLYVRPLK